MNKFIISIILSCCMGACWKEHKDVGVLYYDTNYTVPVYHVVPQIVQPAIIWIPVVENRIYYTPVTVSYPCYVNQYWIPPTNNAPQQSVMQNVWVRYNY